LHTLAYIKQAKLLLSVAVTAGGWYTLRR